MTTPWGTPSSFTGSPDELEQLIDWKAGGIDVLRHYRLDTITRGAHMQRMFTIELRVDFADKDKLPAITQTLRHAARHAFATAQLISDNPKTTQIAIFSDDFFSGKEEIALLDDVIQKGLDETGNVSGDGGSVSSEMMDAFK